MALRLMEQDGAFAAAMAHVKACELGVASCYVCPNTKNAPIADDRYFTGALAVGYPVLPDLEAPPKRAAEGVLL
jgi:hypothetical protein